MSIFAQNLKFYRKQAGLTQQQLAEKLNISRSTISKWETDFQQPSLNDINTICALFKIDASSLVDKRDSKQKVLYERQNEYAVNDIVFNDQVYTLFSFLSKHPNLEKQLVTLSTLPTKSQKKLIPLIQVMLEQTVALEK